jgi:uncharacterized lipoprotein YddW (UPF0748 family)
MSTTRSLVLCCALIAACGTVADAQTYRTNRGIRGAYLRPPTTLTGPSSLETQLQGLAKARVTDLFLETLYWGVTTGKKGVFNNRFTRTANGQTVPYDYFADAIPLAAKYNIRMHAWCETAYLQFGSTGAYNFTINAPGESQGDPAWTAINISTGAGGGDGTSGQVFGNLAHPGLQAKIRAYFAELAGYPGLWGIQTDYHRFALDNNLSDSYPSPWSYDAWTRSAFQAAFGSDPQLTARFPGDAQYNNFLAWRNTQIVQAASQMKQGVDGVNPSIEFSISMFPNPEVAKCQDWRTMASTGAIEWLMPQVYGSTASNISSNLNTVSSSASGKRVIATLYVDSTVNHPTIDVQLTATLNTNPVIRDWCFFSSPSFQSAPSQTLVSNHVLSTAYRKQRGDFNDDGYIDARDWTLFRAVYNGTAVSSGGANARYNYVAGGSIDETDWTAFKLEFLKARFGEEGIMDFRDLAALIGSFGVATPAGYPGQNLYDLNGDGIVNYVDLSIVAQLPGGLLPDSDVNASGRTDIEDLYSLNQNLNRDVNRDGVINSGDIATLETLLKIQQ